MKTIILSLALVTGLTFGLHAQDAKAKKKDATPAERAKMGADHAEKKLGLTADQKTKWEAAALERINANEPLREKMKGSTTPEERKTIRQQAKANNDKFDAAIKAFLTADQQAKFEKMREERRKKMREKHKAKTDDDLIDVED